MVSTEARSISNRPSSDAIAQRILASAKDEFAQFGYEGARMQRVADRAGVPKPNIHYHYKSKRRLYLAVLETTIESWNRAFNDVDPEANPAEVLEAFIRDKLSQAQQDPAASRVFANEMIQGAPNLNTYLHTDMQAWLQTRTAVIRQWMDQNKMQKVDPERLIFLIWAATQHYADFQVQALALLNRAQFNEQVATETADFLVSFILRGCGLSSERTNT